jgi:dishevelled associated activator of morphogenesis
MVRTEDEKELAKRFDAVHVDTKSASSMFDMLKAKLNHTTAYPHMLSLLQHLLLLPRKNNYQRHSLHAIYRCAIESAVDYGAQPQYWLLLDRVTQQLVLQSESQEDPDVAPLQINVKEILQE